MYRHYELCPKCKCIQNMTLSIALQPIFSPIGVKEEIILLNFHCEICNSFVKSMKYDESQNSSELVSMNSIPGN